MMRWVPLKRGLGRRLFKEGVDVGIRVPDGIHWFREVPILWRFTAPRLVVKVENHGRPYKVAFVSGADGTGRAMETLWSLRSDIVALRVRSAPVAFFFFFGDTWTVPARHIEDDFLSTPQVRKKYPKAKLI